LAKPGNKMGSFYRLRCLHGGEHRSDEERICRGSIGEYHQNYFLVDDGCSLYEWPLSRYECIAGTKNEDKYFGRARDRSRGIYEIEAWKSQSQTRGVTAK
jgi:hypothetical protein